MMDDLGSCLGAIIICLGIWIFFALVHAFGFALCSSLYLGIAFANGWHAAWAHPGWIAFFSLLSAIPASLKVLD